MNNQILCTVWAQCRRQTTVAIWHTKLSCSVSADAVVVSVCTYTCIHRLFYFTGIAFCSSFQFNNDYHDHIRTHKLRSKNNILCMEWTWNLIFSENGCVCATKKMDAKIFCSRNYIDRNKQESVQPILDMSVWCVCNNSNTSTIQQNSTAKFLSNLMFVTWCIVSFGHRKYLSI